MKSIYEFNPDDAKRFAHEQGIRTMVRGDELQFRRCPYCGNTTDEKNKFSINLRTGQFNCFRASCGAKGNMITLARDFGFSLGNMVDEYFDRKKKYRDLTRYPRPTTRAPAVEYLCQRGIGSEITERYGITTQKDNDNVLVFPFFDDSGRMQFVKYRKTDFDKEKDSSKEWCERDCKPILFGMDQCDPDRSRTLVLTEGQIDSLSVVEAFDGEVNAVSVPTGCNGFTWVPYCWDFLGKFNELIVFGDFEKGRITLLDEMRKRFHGTVKHVRETDYQDCKDANELLIKYGKAAVVDAVEQAVPVECKHIKKLSEVVRKDMSQMEAIDTGIAQLNKLIGGFYFGQLVILTGERGLGKSTLSSQFVMHAVNQGITSFCYSGELQEWFFQDWFDRQCAGRDYINVATSELGYDNYLIDAAALELIHDWYDEKMYIFDNDIVGNMEDEPAGILETLETAIKQYGCRFLMIDNFMTAISDDLKSDLYRQQSAFVRALTEMAKKYNVLILLIVHPRKRNGNQFGNDDVAGSSNITNLADVVLNYALPRDDMDVLPERVLQVTKNRLNGKTNYVGIPLWYDIPSKRILEAIGMSRYKLKWDIGDDFMKLPDMGEEVDINF